MIKPRYLVFSDPHIHAYKAFDKSGSRLKNCLKAVNKVFAHAHKEGIDIILCAGDWYDTQRVLVTEVVNQSIALLQAWYDKNPNIKLVCITGNHDLGSKCLYNQDYVSGIRHLQAACPNFLVCDNTHVELAGLSVYGLPYYDDKNDLSKALTDLVGSVPLGGDCTKVLLMHNVPSNMDSAHLFADFNINDPRFQIFDFVYNGHIHQKNWLGDHFLVVGSLLHKSAEDIGSEKGYWKVEGPLHTHHTLDDILPVFRYGDPTTPGKDYVLPEAKVKVYETAARREAKEALDKLALAKTPEDKIRVYWQQNGKGDEKLLQTGLSLFA